MFFVFLTAFGLFLALGNETFAQWFMGALMVVGTVSMSPFLLSSIACEKVFGWDSKSWKIGLFTVLGGFALYSLIGHLIVHLFF